MSLGQQLHALEASGLIRLAQTEPELEYLFRHTLVQEAAYGSLVKQDRRHLHRKVGETLEHLYTDQLASREIAPLLARHFAEAGDDPRALHYFALAGDAAMRVYANAEAVLHYTHALEIARRTPTFQQFSAEVESLRHLYLSRGESLELSARYAEALTNYEEMAALALERDDRSLELMAVMARAKIYATPNPVHDAEQAQTLLEQSLGLARGLRPRGDQAAECKVLWNLMVLLVWGGGDQRQAIRYGEQALALARELGLQEQLAFTLNDLTYAYMGSEQWEEARVAVDEAIELWRSQETLPMLVDSLSNSAVLYIRSGQYDQAVATAEEALRVSRAIGNVWGQATSRLFIGFVYLERGELTRAIEIMQEAIRLGEQVGHATGFTVTRADLGWAYATHGMLEHGLEMVQQAHARAAGEKLSLLRAASPIVLGRLLILKGDLAGAEAALQEGRRELKEGLAWLLPILLPLGEGELALAQRDAPRVLA
ncbi:MAG: tetratricopeptide repeat protein, partial [Anaerolineales bacterium]